MAEFDDLLELLESWRFEAVGLGWLCHKQFLCKFFRQS
jgi:hypothetical protein